jgi:hypothetical protein
MMLQPPCAPIGKSAMLCHITLWQAKQPVRGDPASKRRPGYIEGVSQIPAIPPYGHSPPNDILKVEETEQTPFEFHCK